MCIWAAENNLTTLYKSVFAGTLIGLAAIVSAYASYPQIIFAVGLISVIYCHSLLYTGMIGKTRFSEYKKIILVLFGNLIGVWIMCGYTIGFIGIELFKNIIQTKESFTLLYVLVSSIFCGILMCVATVLNPNRNILVIVFCIAAFILGKFPHCIADTFYLSLDGIDPHDIVYIIHAIIGNTVGAKLAYWCTGGNRNEIS